MGHLHKWILLFLVLSLLILAQCGRPHPTDQAMLDFFHKHQNAFEQLGQELRQETEFDYINAETGDCRTEERTDLTRLQREHCAAYVEQLRSLNIFVAYPFETVVLIVSARGLSVSGSAKGYSYGQPQWCEVVAVTDTFDFGSHGEACLAIGGEWYIFYSAT